MKWRIISWNCRGNGMGKIRSAEQYLLKQENEKNIVLLQEAGNPDDIKTIEQIGSGTRGIGFNCIKAPQFNVKNHRCSLAIMTQADAKLWMNSAYIKGLTRPCLYTVIVDGFRSILVGTMHAYSDGGGKHSREEIIAVVTWFNKVKTDGACSDWILIGDFNHVMNDHLKAEISSISQHIPLHTATQLGGNEIDYVIFSKGNGIEDKIKCFVEPFYRDSDHRAIWLDITI